MGNNKKENQQLKEQRLYEEQYNNQGCLMKIIEYNGANDIVVEFQDENKYKVHTTYQVFHRRNVKNPYYPSVYGVGIVGIKYIKSKNGIPTKEYDIWKCMLKRCFNKKYKEKQPTYKDVTCCDEWLNFDNFYEWLHSQENFDKWLNGNKWAIDKDILVKDNKVYSPETCCLVPQNVNNVFIIKNTKQDIHSITIKEILEYCHNNDLSAKQDNIEYIQKCISRNKYKVKKEMQIKQIAKIEYNNGNITKKCYEAMMSYKVEITD